MENKKKILIYYSIFNIGGAERSTSKLITKFLDRGHLVDVLLITNGGDFQGQIDSRATISWLRSGDYGSLYSASSGLSKIKYIALYGITRIEQAVKTVALRTKKYDVVIIGLHGLSPEYCIKNINSKVYIQLIRNDLKLCDTEGKASANVRRFGKHIDFYVCVSQTALDSFRVLFPKVEHKALKIYNLLEAPVIKEKSQRNEDTSPIDTCFETSILTVCRIQDKSKALFRMADICKELLEKGYAFKWFIIGDGPDYKKLKDYLLLLDIAEDMVLLGQRSNPYPYFKSADLIAVLSYYEGLCGVVNEAKILERPLIATLFSGITEQIDNGTNGIIVDNDKISILIGLEKLLNNPELINRMAINNMPTSITNDNLKIDQFEQLFVK